MSNVTRPLAFLSGHLWVVALTSAGFFMAAINAFAMITALPSIQRDLGASLETLKWTVSAYSLTAAGFIITAAALGDRAGHVFTTGLALFASASALCAVAPGTSILIAGRELQGLGAAWPFFRADVRRQIEFSGRQALEDLRQSRAQES